MPANASFVGGGLGLHNDCLPAALRRSAGKPGVALAVSGALAVCLATHPQVSSGAESADPASPLIQEVVVTARKREETLSDVSAAISVVAPNSCAPRGSAMYAICKSWLPS
jgi:outer membrane receptor protein involved in Fe transport